MWDFHIGKAIGLLLRTIPFLLLRLAVYGGIALTCVLMTALGAGIGYGMAGIGGADARTAGALIGGLIGFGITGGILYWLREYLLYLVKAGHIAVLVELMMDSPLPQGSSQIRHGASVVKDRFAQASLLFALDRLVKGVLRTLARVAGGLLSALPGSPQLHHLLHAFLRLAVGLVDEVVLAHAIHAPPGSNWASARDALILYGQNWKVMFRNAAWLMALLYMCGIALFLAMLVPASLLAFLLPDTLSFLVVAFALLFAWCVKVAVLEPFAILCLMQVYFETIEGQTPSPEWEARLAQMSDQFRSIKERALSSAG